MMMSSMPVVNGQMFNLLLDLFLDISNWLRIHDLWLRFFSVRWRFLPGTLYHFFRTLHYIVLLLVRSLFDLWGPAQMLHP